MTRAGSDNFWDCRKPVFMKQSIRINDRLENSFGWNIIYSFLVFNPFPALPDLKTPIPAFPHGGRSRRRCEKNHHINLSPPGEIRKGVSSMK
jgi:hypothetical protein